MVVFLLLSTAFADECVFLSVVEAAETTVDDPGSATRAELFEAATDALSCGELVDQEHLARFWLAVAVSYRSEGASDDESGMIQAACHALPNFRADYYGPKARELHDDLCANPPNVDGRIVLDTVPGGWVTALNGIAQPFPAAAAPGWHVVQVGRTENEMSFASLTLLIEDESIVKTGLRDATAVVAPVPVPEAVVPTVAAVPDPAARRPFPLLPITAGVFSAGALTTYGLAVRENGVMDRADSVSQLNAAFARQKRLAYTTSGLSLVASSALIATLLTSKRRKG